MKLVLAIFFTISGLLYSCNPQIHIASNVPDVIYIAEAYNKKKNNNKVEVYISAKLPELLQEKKDLIDMIITHFDPEIYNEYFKDEKFQIIKTPPNMVKAHNKMMLISFSLPLIIVLKDMDKGEIDRLHVSLSNLKLISKNIAENLNEKTYFLNFYPIDNTFNEIFKNTIEETNWKIDAGINTREIQIYYQEHYMPAPILTRALDTQIRYKYISSDNFFSVPANIQEQFNVYILMNNDKQIPLVNPLFLGDKKDFLFDPKRISEKKFAKWLSSEEGQKEILETKRQYENKAQSYYIGNTLSSLWNTNQKYIFTENDFLYKNQPLLKNLSTQ